MASAGEIAAGAAVELVFIAIALAVLYRLWGWFFPVPKRLVVQAFQQGVVVVDGKVERILKPGGYWISPKRRVVLCDVRPTPFQVPSQELLTADGGGVRIGLAGEYRIASPGVFVTESSDAFAGFYLELRQALRVAAGEVAGSNLVNGQAQLTTRIRELLLPRDVQLGIALTRLEIDDVFPIGSL